MTRLVTSGMCSCGTLAIAGFGMKHRAFEDEYLKSGKEANDTSRSERDVVEFYNQVIYPTEQELGETKEYAFSHLMKIIDDEETAYETEDEIIGNKYLSLCLAGYQLNYWRPKVEYFGFKLVDVTCNPIGGYNYIFTRNRNRISKEYW